MASWVDGEMDGLGTSPRDGRRQESFANGLGWCGLNGDIDGRGLSNSVRETRTDDGVGIESSGQACGRHRGIPATVNDVAAGAAAVNRNGKGR